MLHPSSSTVAKVRLLKAIAPGAHKRRGGRLPRQQQPDAIREAYFHSLMPHIRAQTDHLKQAAREVLRIFIQDRAARAARGDRMDAPLHHTSEANQVIARAGTQAAQAFRPRELHAVAEHFGKATSAFQKDQFDRQLRTAIGVPYSMIEKPTRDLVPLFAKNNVELVKTVAPRYHDRLARDAREAFESGMRAETFAARLVELDDMAESDAMRLARDQIGKLNGEFNEVRQESLGITQFVWRTVNDQRVRDSHAELEGETFDWDDPPEDDDGETITPGSAIQCRCFAEPVFDDIVSGL